MFECAQLSDEIHTTINKSVLNSQLTLKGIALDAKAGAVLKLSSGEIVYLENHAFWQDDLVQKEVSVTGKLVEKKLIPDPHTAENGAKSAGAFGIQFVLECAKILEK